MKSEIRISKKSIFTPKNLATLLILSPSDSFPGLVGTGQICAVAVAAAADPRVLGRGLLWLKNGHFRSFSSLPLLAHLPADQTVLFSAKDRPVGPTETPDLPKVVVTNALSLE